VLTLRTITPSFDVEQLTNGPFSVAGKLYQLCNAAHQPIQMFESSDQGATWTVKDSGHAPTSSLSGVSFCYDGAITFWIAYANGSGFVEFISFNTATGLYGAVTTTTNAASSNEMFVWYRSVDAKVVYVLPVTVPSRAASFVFDTVGLTFTALAPMGTNGVITVPIGAFQQIGLTFIVFITFGSVPLSLFYQSVDTAGNIGAINVLETTAVGYTNPPTAVCSDGTTVMIAWPDVSTGANFSVWEAPIATLVFVNQVLAGLVQPDTAAAVISAGTIVLFTEDQGNLYKFQDSGGGFGGKTLVIALGGFSNVLANLVSVVPGIGIVVDTEPPVSYLFSAAPTSSGAIIDSGGLQYAQLPSIGSVCRFARPHRQNKGPRVIQVGKTLTYPTWYGR
jgi:hypothetical protein